MTINDIFKEFDTLDKKNFDEFDVCSALRTLISKNENEILIDDELRAEIIAFEFEENFQYLINGNIDYYTHYFISNKNNEVSKDILINELITTEMIYYWEKRVNETINPILKARYSGLVWDFKKIVTNNLPNHNICRIHINSLIDIANGDFQKHEVDTLAKLKRALTLAISLNDDDLVEKVKNAIISFEKRHSIDDKPGSWGHSFDLLIDNKKVNLTISEEQEIIRELENKLNRLITANNENRKTNLWAAEEAAIRLATYYSKRQKNKNAKRVILEVGNAYNKKIADAPALQAYDLLDHLYKLYLKFNLNNEAEALLPRIRELESKIALERMEITYTCELPRDEMEEYIVSIINGNPHEIIFHIANIFIPIKKIVKEQILYLSKVNPMFYLIPQRILDDKGHTIAKIGPLEQDPEGHFIRQVFLNFFIENILLRAILNEAIKSKRLSKEDFLSFLNESKVFNEDRFLFIDKALDAYFQNDYIQFIYLIIPQIEEAIRNILEINGGIVLKSSKNGVFNFKTFDEILRDKIIKEVLGEDLADYFRILFTDQRGYNLRNRVCHGLVDPNIFNQQVSDRVLHSLLCLGVNQIKYNF
jgi:hypothetical protein